jgi:lysophospholipase L1-like esterase
MQVWHRVGPLLAFVLALNLVPMVVAPSIAMAEERPSLTYLALGDSYASGHGLFDDGTPCRRSQYAYPYWVSDALSATYSVDFGPERHLACSGATAGTNTDTSDPDKSISHQFETANTFLDDRDASGNSDPVLVTITIGANDVGLLDPDTWGQIARRPNLNMRVGAAATGFRISPLLGVAVGVVATLPTTSAVGFFEWLDAKSRTIASGLTPGIDNLLAHENVYIVLTDYPNPLPDGAFDDLWCNDIFGSLTCGEAVDRVVQRLNSLMLDQFLQVYQPGRLRVATLGTGFSAHPVELSARFSWPPVGCLTGTDAPNTWFQGDCAHPNKPGAQAIADVVFDVARVMLPVSVIPDGDQGEPAMPPVAWPSDRDDNPSPLYIWLGANMYGFPDWVACDDARAYCLVGYPGKEHLLVQMSGLVVIGQVADASPDPRQALLALGLPEEIVTQILRPQNGGQGGNAQVNVPDGNQGGNAQVTVPDDEVQGAAESTQDTWTASVQVELCDAPPNSGSDMNCHAEAGIVVDISLASGEVMGSCTTGEPQPTPWNTFISTCTVEGLPFNADFVATQDPSTIPSGYEPWEESLSLHVDDLHPGGGDQATFTFFNVLTDISTSAPNSPGTSVTDAPSAPTEVAVAPESTGTADPMSLLPSIADVPDGLVETGRRTRTLPEVVANYTDPAETTQLFTGWGWQGNAVASFALPSGQEAQSGQVNGVYVSIHQFSGPDEARAALDFSLSEQAAGTDLQEVTTRPLGEYTRALYGPEDYGNETTVLVQQGNVFIRVSAAMLDGDPTADAVSVTEAILLKVAAQQATTIDQGTSGATGSANTPDSSNSSGTGGLTVEFWDNRNNMRDTTSQCVHLAGVTETLCSYDSPDGLIQFDGVPAGTYEICVTRRFELPAGEPYWSWARSLGPVSVTIAPGSHEAITLYVFMVFQNPDPGDPTLCGFDPRESDSNGSASSSTAGTTIVADTSGSTTAPAPGGSGEATLLMTFRGCPDGFDPATDDFYANCTIPLDAPDNAFVDFHGEGQGGEFIAMLDRQYNGEYVYTANPGTMNVELRYLGPVVRDAYQVFGTDGGDGSSYTVNLIGGETREVFVFYWYS